MDGDNESDGDSRDQPQPQRARQDEQPPRSRGRAPSDRADNRRDRPNGRDRDDDDGRGRSTLREDANERIDFAVLPPAIGDIDGATLQSSDELDAPRPRRQARTVRSAVSGDDTTTSTRERIV